MANYKFGLFGQSTHDSWSKRLPLHVRSLVPNFVPRNRWVWVKIKPPRNRTAGFSPFGHLFLTHSQICHCETQAEGFRAPFFSLSDRPPIDRPARSSRIAATGGPAIPPEAASLQLHSGLLVKPRGLRRPARRTGLETLRLETGVCSTVSLKTTRISGVCASLF